MFAIVDRFRRLPTWKKWAVVLTGLALEPTECSAPGGDWLLLISPTATSTAQADEIPQQSLNLEQ